MMLERDQRLYCLHEQATLYTCQVDDLGRGQTFRQSYCHDPATFVATCSTTTLTERALTRLYTYARWLPRQTRIYYSYYTASRDDNYSDVLKAGWATFVLEAFADRRGQRARHM
jgi:hypothetical protein